MQKYAFTAEISTEVARGNFLYSPYRPKCSFFLE